MRSGSIFLAAVVLLPIQNFGFNLGIMTLKLSQALFIIFLFFALSGKRSKIGKSARFFVALLFSVLFAFLLSSLNSDFIGRAFVLTFAFAWCALFSISAILFLENYQNSFDRLVKALVLSASAYSIYGVAQLTFFFLGLPAHVNFEPWDVVPRVPYFSSENVHAAFLLIAIPLIFFRLLNQKGLKNYVKFGSLLAVNFVGLVATGSRAAIIALVVGLILMMALELRKSLGLGKLLRILCIVSLTVYAVMAKWDTLFVRFNSLLTGHDGTTSVRTTHYSEMFHFFVEQPILGIGLGGAQEVSTHDVHNVFLQVLFEGGIFAIALFLLLIFSPLFLHVLKPSHSYVYRRGSNNAVLISYFIVLLQACAEPALYFYHLYLVLVMLLSAKSPSN